MNLFVDPRALEAELLVRAGAAVEARDLLDGRIDVARAAGAFGWLPELLRLRAVAHAACGAPDEAVADLDAAAELAAATGAKTFVARVAATRATLTVNG